MLHMNLMDFLVFVSLAFLCFFLDIEFLYGQSSIASNCKSYAIKIFIFIMKNHLKVLLRFLYCVAWHSSAISYNIKYYLNLSILKSLCCGKCFDGTKKTTKNNYLKVVYLKKKKFNWIEILSYSNPLYAIRMQGAQ